MLENYKEVVEALEETNESYISHRVNDILRVLTAISVIVLPLTLIASIWGMNVGVPGEGDADGLLRHRRRDGRAARRRWSPTSAAAAGSRPASIPRMRPCGQPADLGALAPRVREGRVQGLRAGVHLLRQAGRGRRRGEPDRPPRRALLRDPQPVPVHERAPDGRPLRRTSARSPTSTPRPSPR